MNDDGQRLDLCLIYNINTFDYGGFNNIYTLNSNEDKGLFKRTITLLTSLVRLLKIIKRYDTIVINDVTALNVLAILCRAFYRGKIIFWSHLGKSYFVEVAKKSVIFINYFTLRYIADKIICVSNHARDETVKYLNNSCAGKICTVYNIVIANSEVNCNKLSDKVVNLLSVTRLCKEKGVDILIKAFNQVIEHGYEDLLLTICGSGEELDNLKQLVVLYGLKEKVIFVGQVNNPVDYIK
ncbi:MAG: glycosyltransferase, partial [Burkholderiales bacterium]|nr:glycosyltransferase [Burkholderiales bacterium]